MPKRKTKGEIILRFREVHGDKYDYSLVNYVNQNTNIKIVCPIHGVFEQRPQHHGNGSGCTKCANNMRSRDEFIEIFKDVHGDRYDYSKSYPKTTKGEIDIICKKHGVFSQIVSNHIKGSGCIKCSHDDFALKQIKPLNKHIEDFRKVHGNKYDYSKTNIELSRKKCIVVCPEHGEFQITPKNHMAGYGCPSCSNNGGFKSSKSGILYVLKVLMLDGTISYKVGITNRSVKRRYSNNERESILDFNEYWFWSGLDALNTEKLVKRKFSKNLCDKYNYPLKHGFSECFDLDFDLNIYIKTLVD